MVTRKKRKEKKKQGVAIVTSDKINFKNGKKTQRRFYVMARI